MKRKAAFRRAASAELMDAAARYESQRSNLGVEFLDEIDRCVSLALERPDAFPAVKQDVRRITARRFPFNVYFKVEAKRIVVLAVFHSSRDPAIWQARA